MDEASRRRVIINTDAKNEADDSQDPQVRPGAPMVAGLLVA
jgi:hypothetical protein